MFASFLRLFSRQIRHSCLDSSRGSRRGRLARCQRLGIEFLEGRTVPAVITVTSLLDTVANDGQVTLREAILAADTDTSVDGSTKGSGPDTIQFAANVVGTIILANHQLETNSSISIVGPGADQLTIDAHGLSRVLFIGGLSFAISGLKLSGGSTTADGGALRIAGGTAEVTGCTISDSASTVGSGGGIANSGSLTIRNSTVASNTAKANGGGIFNNGSLTLSYVKVLSNELTTPPSPSVDRLNGAGGGIYSSGNLVVDGSTVEGNLAVDSGGGIHNSGAVCTITGSRIGMNALNNGPDGGGLYSTTASSLKSTTVIGNSSAYRGGGIWSSASITLEACAIIGNSSSDGGGLYVSSGVGPTVGPATTSLATINRSTFSGNSCPLGNDSLLPSIDDIGGGAAIYARDAKVSIQASTICDNAAPKFASAVTGIVSTNLAPSQARQWISIKSSILARNTGACDVRFAYLYQTDNVQQPDYTYRELRAGVDSSLIQKMTDISGYGNYVGFSGTGNIIGVDPLLAPLADNGGPTLSYMPLPNSPVINRGITLTTFDQRGTGYVGNCGRADMGAIEVQKSGAYLLYNGLGRQLVVAGSAAADIISVIRTTNAKGASFFVVTTNGQKATFSTSSITAITVMGYSGNDKITIDPSVTIDCVVDAGDGDDSVTGGAGADILLGGDGFDMIAGGAGMDILIGGDGHDVLNGGLAKDLVIGGATIFDNSIDMLLKVRMLWNSGASFDDKVSSLLTGKGGMVPLAADSVSDNFYDQIMLDVTGMELVYASDEDDVAPLAGNRKIRVLT